MRDGAGVVDVDRWADKLPEFDLFAKKLLFVPINESLHWSLAVVVNPCSLAEGKPDARIMVLDSLRCHKPKKVVKLLRTYLFHEWRKREDKDKKAKASQASRCQGAGGSDRDGDECERWNEHEFNRLLPLETVNNVSVLHWCFLFLCAALTSMLWLCASPFVVYLHSTTGVGLVMRIVCFCRYRCKTILAIAVYLFCVTS